MKTFDYHSLDEKRFEKLMSQLLVISNPRIKPVNGSGGDVGVDCFEGEYSGKKNIWQFKFFPDTLKVSHKYQIMKSLRTAKKNHEIGEWTLVLPKELTPAEHIWWEELKNKNTGIKLSFMGESKLNNLLVKHPKIAEVFFPKDLLVRKFDQFRQVMKLIKEQGIVKSKDELKPLSHQFGVCRLQILGDSAETVIKRFEQYFPSKRKTEIAVKKIRVQDGAIDARVLFRKGKSSFIFESEEGDPFYLIYPRVKSIDFTLMNVSNTTNICEMTIFTASKGCIHDIRTALGEALESSTQIKEITLDAKMKQIVRQFSTPIDAIRFDPAIMERLKEENGTEYEARVKRETLIGERIMNLKWVQNTIGRVERVKKGGISQIYYIRAKRASGFDKDHVITFEVHRDGRINAFFPPHLYTRNEMKEVLQNFLENWI